MAEKVMTAEIRRSLRLLVKHGQGCCAVMDYRAWCGEFSTSKKVCLTARMVLLSINGLSSGYDG